MSSRSYPRRNTNDVHLRTGNLHQEALDFKHRRETDTMSLNMFKHANGFLHFSWFLRTSWEPSSSFKSWNGQTFQLISPPGSWCKPLIAEAAVKRDGFHWSEYLNSLNLGNMLSYCLAIFKMCFMCICRICKSVLQDATLIRSAKPWTVI